MCVCVHWNIFNRKIMIMVTCKVTKAANNLCISMWCTFGLFCNGGLPNHHLLFICSIYLFFCYDFLFIYLLLAIFIFIYIFINWFCFTQYQVELISSSKWSIFSVTCVYPCIMKLKGVTLYLTDPYQFVMPYWCITDDLLP